MNWTYHEDDDGWIHVIDHSGTVRGSMLRRHLHVFGGAEGYVKHTIEHYVESRLDTSGLSVDPDVFAAAWCHVAGAIEQTDEPPAPTADTDTDSDPTSADGTGAGLGPDRDVPEEGIGPSDRADDTDGSDDTAAEEGWSFDA
jgi:hypothetical protein